jgi:hypothetical protein
MRRSSARASTASSPVVGHPASEIEDAAWVTLALGNTMGSGTVSITNNTAAMQPKHEMERRLLLDVVV